MGMIRTVFVNGLSGWKWKGEYWGAEKRACLCKLDADGLGEWRRGFLSVTARWCLAKVAILENDRSQQGPDVEGHAEPTGGDFHPGRWLTAGNVLQPRPGLVGWQPVGDGHHHVWKRTRQKRHFIINQKIIISLVQYFIVPFTRAFFCQIPILFSKILFSKIFRPNFFDQNFIFKNVFKKIFFENFSHFHWNFLL